MTWCPLYRRLCGPQGWYRWAWKILPSLAFNLLAIQPLVSHYTDCAILVHIRTYVEGVMLVLKVHGITFYYFVFMCHFNGLV
jgi:hypothetical protein